MKKMTKIFRAVVAVIGLLVCIAGNAQQSVWATSKAGRLESNGGLAVNLQDQTTRPLDLYFTQVIGAPTSLSDPTALDDTSVVVASAANISIGNYIGIFSGTSLEAHFYFAEVLDVSGTTIFVDSPLDFAFDAADPVISTTREMDVDGLDLTQTFTVTNGTAATEIEIDLTRIVFQIIATDGPELTDFGDIATGLTHGVVLRRNNATTENIFNVKTNGDLLNLMYDLTFYAAAGPGPLGANGLGGRYTFAGQDKHGVAVRLAGGESLELIIQDDLTDLLLFRMIAQGHIVTP